MSHTSSTNGKHNDLERLVKQVYDAYDRATMTYSDGASVCTFEDVLEELDKNPEYKQLKDKIQKALEIQTRYNDTMAILNKQDLAYDLMNLDYWDLRHHGSYLKLETRQEYDRETCLAIRDFIIHLIKNGGQNQHTDECRRKSEYYDKYFKTAERLGFNAELKADVDKSWIKTCEEFSNNEQQLQQAQAELDNLKEENRNLKFRIADEQDCHTHEDCRKEIDALKAKLDKIAEFLHANSFFCTATQLQEKLQSILKDGKP